MKDKILLLFSLVLMSCNKEKDVTLSLNSFPKNSSESFLLSTNDNLFISWTEQVADSNFLYISKLEDNSWSDKSIIKKGKDWFVNWADFPSISYNEISNSLFSFHLQKSSEETFSYDVNYHINQGSSWKDMQKIHDDNTFSEHGFVSSIPYKDGFMVSWLDGRNTYGKGHDGHAKGAMTIRSAILDNTGKIINESLIDGMVCDCCQTSMAISNDIPIIVYRDRSKDEIRDIYYSRYIDSNWTDPKPIHDDGWEINGCPVNGPNIDSNEENVVVSWFSASNGRPKVNLKFSRDNGRTFGDKILVDNIENSPIGRVDVEFISSDEVIISWLSTVEGKGKLLMRKIGVNGSIGEIKVIDEVSTERSTGFPQIEKFNDNIYISWTDNTQLNKNVRVTTLPISIL
ncbi:MAG: sialidase family protein [Flammeovirgaceae bacterium]